MEKNQKNFPSSSPYKILEQLASCNQGQITPSLLELLDYREHYTLFLEISKLRPLTYEEEVLVKQYLVSSYMYFEQRLEEKMHSLLLHPHHAELKDQAYHTTTFMKNILGLLSHYSGNEFLFFTYPESIKKIDSKIQDLLLLDIHPVMVYEKYIASAVKQEAYETAGLYLKKLKELT
ncbi:MAG: hypothetical protein QW594_00685 [Candidatus Woesearchaeota archaeon]